MPRKSALTSAAALLGSKGGKATAKNLTAEERSASARRAALARNERLTAEERSAIARKGALARAANYRQRKKQGEH